MPLSSSDLIVEDGTVVADANAYITIAFADSYHELRGNVSWANADEPQKVAAIVQATDYIDSRWRFVGTRDDEDQTLEWPRAGACDKDGFEQEDNVPTIVKQTVAEYAMRALSASLLPDPEVDPNGKYIIYKREKVGPLEEETRYSNTRSPSFLKPYPAADRRLTASGLVISAGGRVIHA
jgi:hypothetical protein